MLGFIYSMHHRLYYEHKKSIMASILLVKAVAQISKEGTSVHHFSYKILVFLLSILGVYLCEIL